MRCITLTAYQYRNFVYPAVVTSGAKRLDEWEVALRTVRKLKDPALTTDLPLTDEQRKAKDEGNAVYPERTLLGGEAVFALHGSPGSRLGVATETDDGATVFIHRFGQLVDPASPTLDTTPPSKK